MRFSEVWRVGEDVPCCELAGEGKIIISRRAFDRMIALTEAMAPNEWFGYLTGKVEGHKAMVTGIVVPRQRVDMGSAEPLEYPLGVKNIIGTVHSHGSLSATGRFSGVDTSYSAANHRVSLLVGREPQGMMRVRTKCKRWTSIPASVEVAKPEDKFVHENLSKITVCGSVGYDEPSRDVAPWTPPRSLFDYQEFDYRGGK